MNIRRLLFILIAFGCTVARAGVSTESPFVPRGPAANPVASNTPIELRGITSDEKGPRFAIYDPAKKEGAWVRIDEKGQAFTVRSYDEATKRIVVDYQGRSQTIALVEPKFGPGKAVATTVASATPQRPAGVQPVQSRVQPGSQRTAQPSADDSKRLEAIRAEVARRRAAREAGAQQNQQQQQPQR